MRSRPNRTVLSACVESVEPASDGIGCQIKLRVLSNDSPAEGEDFLQPEPGATLAAFWLEPNAAAKPGAQVKVELTNLAGPFGAGRAVIQKMRRAR